MPLKSIWPIAEVVSRAPSPVLIFESLTLEEIERLKPDNAHEIVSFILMQARHKITKARRIINFCQSTGHGLSDAALLTKVEEAIKTKLLESIFYGKCLLEDNAVPYRTVSELLVANIAPLGILYISDIEFSNPRKPITPGTGLRWQSHKGLGLLSTLLENASLYAKKNSLPNTFLVAASRSHVPVFERHGFKVSSQSDKNSIGHQRFGAELMEKNITLE